MVGTAAATRNAVNRRQADKNAAAYAHATNTYVQETAPQQYAPPPQEQVIPATAAPQEDAITQLERLGTLKAQGILTEEEFQTQKAKLLGM